MSPQNSVALASIQLPPSLFSSLPAALAPPVPPDCTLQLLVFRNGRLFRSHGNTSRPGASGPGKRRGVATPVIFAGTSKGLNSSYHLVSLHSALPQPTLAPNIPMEVAEEVAPHHFQGDRGQRCPIKKGIRREKAWEDTGFYIPDLPNFERAVSINP